MKQPWTKAGREPALWDVLADPIVVKLMQADRITRSDVLRATVRPDDQAAADEAERLTA
jgi:hypothetical protein